MGNISLLSSLGGFRSHVYYVDCYVPLICLRQASPHWSCVTSIAREEDGKWTDLASSSWVQWTWDRDDKTHAQSSAVECDVSLTIWQRHLQNLLSPHLYLLTTFPTGQFCVWEISPSLVTSWGSFRSHVHFVDTTQMYRLSPPNDNQTFSINIFWNCGLIWICFRIIKLSWIIRISAKTPSDLVQ